MPSFQYRAVAQDGSIVNGSIEAVSTAAFLSELERRALLAIEIGDGRSVSAASLPKAGIKGVAGKDITRLTEDLGMLLGSGVLLDRALLILAQTAHRSSVARLADSLNQRIAEGHSFAEALAFHPQMFPRSYVKVIEVAEVAGTMADTLAVLVHERRRVEQLQRRISSSLAYPAFLAIAAIAVLGFILTTVIPEFDRALGSDILVAENSAALIFELSRLVRANETAIALSAALFLAFGLVALRSQWLARAAISLLAAMPGLSTLFQYERTVSFCATLGMLLRSGVDISVSLRLLGETMRDANTIDALDEVLKKVRRGQPLSNALLTVNLLPVYAIHMLRVGEESELGLAAARVAAVYEEKLTRSLTRLTAILGPVILLAVSALIGWIIVSVMGALLSLNEALL